MYSVILNLMFVALALLSLLVRSLMPDGGDAELTFFVFTMIFTGAWVVSLFAMTINHFVTGETIIKEIEEIKTRINKIKLKEEKKTELMDFMQKQVLEVFPKFEEKVLETLSPQNNKDIIALFQKYPELKSSKHLSQLMKDVTGLVEEVYTEKRYLEDSKEIIRSYKSNPWFLVKVRIPEDVNSLIYQ